jgi:predicted nucleic acid-binding protein
MRYLLDSNVLSEPTKKRPDPQVIEWLNKHRFDSVVSVLALGEVERGILKLPDGNRRRNLLEWFTAIAEGMERDGRVIAIDRKLMTFWAEVYNREEKLTQRKPPFMDTLLAATAELHGLTMVTRNVKDFPASLPVINPWEL